MHSEQSLLEKQNPVHDFGLGNFMYTSSETSSSDTVSTQTWVLYTGLFLERTQLRIPVRTDGIFYFPWHRQQIEATDGF